MRTYGILIGTGHRDLFGVASPGPFIVTFGATNPLTGLSVCLAVALCSFGIFPVISLLARGSLARGQCRQGI